MILQIWHLTIFYFIYLNFLLSYFSFLPPMLYSNLSWMRRGREGRERKGILMCRGWENGPHDKSCTIRFGGYFFLDNADSNLPSRVSRLRSPRRINFPGDTSRREHTPLSCPFLYERSRGERESRYTRAPRVGAISPRCLWPIDYRPDSRNDEGGSGAFGETAPRR